MGKMIGIDLGTTNSVVAIVDGPQPRVLENRETKTQTRSVVGVKRRRGAKDGGGAEILVGDAALDNWPMAPRDTIVSIKRLMGRGVADKEVQRIRGWARYDIVEPTDGTRDDVRVMMGGVAHSPVDVSSIILKKLKEDAEYRLGEPVTHAVITVPAYFSQIQRDATRKAGLKAGLRVIKILEEPTAAAIAFGMESGDGSPKTVVVFDLGGGTFDISVLMWAGNVFAPLNLEGDMWLGGDDLDQVLIDHAVRQIRSEYRVDPTGKDRFMIELKRSAQAVKERLTSANSADLIVTGVLQDDQGNLIDVELEITRADFERMILPLVGRFRRCGCGQANFARDSACAVCARPLDPTIHDGRTVELVKKALQHPSVNLNPEQVDYVLMAGNTTNVPLVQKTMEELFGSQRIMRRLHPKHCVAIGAAMMAAWRGATCVCQAPDPKDPSRECGHVNKDDAQVCAGCGANLELESEASPTQPDSKPLRAALGAVGGIAPFNYGTQTAGDEFNVFVHKGDPFPTESAQAMIFRTRVAKQNMVSIPIYGGDNLARASENEKQGEAFAVLPPNLPQGTPVRVKLWLDSDGIFELSAHLDDGANLKPWVMKGGLDAKAIGEIQKMERIVAEKAQDLPADVVASMDQARLRAFDKMRQHDFEGAQEEVARIEKRVMEQEAAANAGALKTRAENWANWSDFVLQHYGWALGTSFGDSMNRMIQELRAHLAAGNAARIEERLAELQAAAARLPEIVRVLLGIRSSIELDVRPSDPARAAQLRKRLEEVENKVHANDPSALAAVDDLAVEISRAIQEIGSARARTCSLGHRLAPGERFCPECRQDTWALDAGVPGR
jgi:molecular chaperone DnaK